MKTPLLCLAVGCSLALSSLAADSDLNYVEQPEGCQVTENGKPVLFYQRTPKSLDGKYTRSNYIHPLYDLDGGVISEDFPKDHLHHRGIFWAWHQLLIGDKKVGDAWECKNFSSDVTSLKISRLNPKVIRMVVTADWKSPLWLDAAGKEKPYVRETTTIDVHAATDTTRALDFHIRLVALEDGLRIGGSDDEKGYSGFSPRIRFPRNLRFAGPNGSVEPKNTAVDAGPWIDMSGKFGESDAISGVAMLSHPSLPEFPSKWILRNKTSMQNAAYPGRVPVLIPREKPLDLRYRLIVHRGDEKQANLAKLQSEYESVK
jgi:hypothetical protein